jgi:beta-galactosidase
MFDFPVASRLEGYMDSKDGITYTVNNERKYMNDKGLVTRDRQTKKDVFYLYKAWWNKKQPTVYITGRRRSKPIQGSPITIKVYSNARSLTLYQNGVKRQTLDASGEDTGLIWKFNTLQAETSDDIFKVVDTDGTNDVW